MTNPKLDPELDERAAKLAEAGNGIGWDVAKLALEYQRKGEPYWAKRIGKPFGVGERWAQTLARTAEFCELKAVAKLKPRQHLRVTHWGAIAAYWQREGIELGQLLEIASDAIAESQPPAPMITVEAVESRLREVFGPPEPPEPARYMQTYSKQIYSWAEKRGPNDAFYPEMIDVAERLKKLAEKMK